MIQATADVSWWIGFVSSLQMRQAAADISWWIGFVRSLQMIALSLLVNWPIGILIWYYHDTFLSFYYCPPPINRTSGSFACCSQIQNVCRELLKRGENSNPFVHACIDMMGGNIKGMNGKMCLSFLHIFRRILNWELAEYTQKIYGPCVFYPAACSIGICDAIT